MKKNLLALVAIVAAITLSSFTAQRFTSYYLRYDVASAGDQKVVGSYYSIGINIPPTESTSAAPHVLNWLRAEDSNGTVLIQNDEVLAAFSIYNIVAPTSLTLNDEVDKPGDLDIKDL